MKKWRLLTLLAICLLLLVGGLCYRKYWLTKPPVGQGPAGPTVSREAFAEPWTTRKVLLLGLGDSVTAGFGVSQRYSYFGLLLANPDDEFPEMKGICLSAVLPNLVAKNLSVSGSTSLQHVKFIEESLETQEPDIFGLIVITTGGNDVIHDYGRSPPREGAMFGATLAQARPWIEAYEKRLQKMVDLLEARFPGGCKIFLADIYDPSHPIHQLACCRQLLQR